MHGPGRVAAPSAAGGMRRLHARASLKVRRPLPASNGGGRVCGKGRARTPGPAARAARRAPGRAAWTAARGAAGRRRAGAARAARRAAARRPPARPPRRPASRPRPGRSGQRPRPHPASRAAGPRSCRPPRTRRWAPAPARGSAPGARAGRRRCPAARPRPPGRLPAHKGVCVGEGLRASSRSLSGPQVRSFAGWLGTPIRPRAIGQSPPSPCTTWPHGLHAQNPGLRSGEARRPRWPAAARRRRRWAGRR